MALLSDRVREAFETWDSSKDGTITKKSRFSLFEEESKRRGLVHLLRKLAPQVSEADLEVLFVAAGAAVPGAVKYQDFITYLWSEDEAARARGLWEDAIAKARERAKRTWPSERVATYWAARQLRFKMNLI